MLTYAPPNVRDVGAFVAVLPILVELASSRCFASHVSSFQTLPMDRAKHLSPCSFVTSTRVPSSKQVELRERTMEHERPEGVEIGFIHSCGVMRLESLENPLETKRGHETGNGLVKALSEGNDKVE